MSSAEILLYFFSGPKSILSIKKNIIFPIFSPVLFSFLLPKIIPGFAMDKCSKFKAFKSLSIIPLTLGYNNFDCEFDPTDETTEIL